MRNHTLPATRAALVVLALTAAACDDPVDPRRSPA